MLYALCAIQSNSADVYAANGSTHLYSSGLHLFKQLLANKLFLLLFVRTVEQQKDFGTVMKVHFASLLSIVLHSRMDYFTEYDHSFISVYTAFTVFMPLLVLELTA